MKFVCLGDSLTAGYGIAPQLCWVSLLSEMTPHTWINAGICGDTTGGMLARMRDDALCHAPDAILLLGGTNDILLTGNFDAARANLSAMVHRCAACGVRPIIGLPLPVMPGAPQWLNSFVPIADAAAVVGRYSNWLAGFSSELRLRVVDFGGAIRALAESSGWRSAYLPDGLHPSPEGHRALARAAAERLGSPAGNFCRRIP